MGSIEQQYLTLLEDLISNGEYTQDRTYTGTYSKFGYMLRHNLSEGFPLLTTKQINFNLVAGELLWFLSGKTDLPSLRYYQNKPAGSNTIWTKDFEKFWTTANQASFKSEECGGFIYGSQLRSWFTEDGDFDQLTTLIDNIKAVKENSNHPMARRLKCSFWNPYDHLVGDKKWCALPACHLGFQCLVREGKLNLSFDMRSNDVFLGLPYNLSSYALLCHILAKLTGLEVGEIVYYGVDVHLYSNHVEQAKEQISRVPSQLPELDLPEFNSLEGLLKLTGADFKLVGYNPQGFIKATQAA